MMTFSEIHKKTIIIILLFAIILFAITPFFVFFRNNINEDFDNYSISELNGSNGIIINWPKIRGIEIDLGQTVFDNYLNIQLSVNDTYKIEFLSDKGAENIFINTGIDVSEGQTIQKIMHFIPENISRKGYREIIIYPINGDGTYSISKLLTAKSPNFQENNDFEDYQIVDFEIPKLEIKIAKDDYEKLEEKRKEALALGILIADSTDLVPADIHTNGKNYKSEIRLKGDWTDHLNTDKWSLRVKVKGGETILGMDEFSLQRQETRNGIWAYLIHEFYREQGGIALRYFFVDVVVNGQYKGVYALEESFSKLPVENSLFRESPIIKYNEGYQWERWAFYNDTTSIVHWSNIEPYNLNKTMNSQYLSGYASYGIDLLDRVYKGDIEVGDAINLDKYAKYAAIMDVFATSHANIWHNMRFYVNPINGKLEPITFDDIALSSYWDSNPSFLFQKNSGILNQITENNYFQKEYFSNLKLYSEMFIEFIENHSNTIDDYEYILRRDNNRYRFSIEKLVLRQDDISKLFVDQGMHCYWRENNDNQYILYINNKNQAPTRIKSIQNLEKKISFEISLPFQLKYKYRAGNINTINFSSDDEFDSSDKLAIEYQVVTNEESFFTTCEKNQFSFFIAGHAYGTPGENDGLHEPFANFLPSLQENDLIDFGVFTGDFVESSSEDSYDDFFDQMKVFTKPIYAAPGNHDERGMGNYYFQKYFGNNYSSMLIENNLLLFLNPDDHSWSISQDQIDLIRQELSSNQNMENIFVFTHQLVWWEKNDERFNGITPNSLEGKNGPGNFWTDVAPIFKDFVGNVYFIAGDVGAFPISEYSFTEVDNFTFISSSMGGNIHDNIIIVYVGESHVDFDLIALNDKNIYTLGNLEDN